MKKRQYTAPPEMFRCVATVVLRDGTTAQCMRLKELNSDKCWQHKDSKIKLALMEVQR